MTSESVQIGQTELGIVHHNGNAYGAIGASVNGRTITGYQKGDIRTGIRLTNWAGETTLASRCSIVEVYRLESWVSSHGYALRFDLTHGRTIIGYSWGDGMLFRGELLDASDREDADYLAKQLAESWIERDAEDDESNDDDSEDSDDV